MAKRLAITIAGAVSLGSYEAGVLYELMRAVRTRNEAATTEDEKIYVDVLTGASAGGMTAAMVSQRLMFDGASLEGDSSNALYQAWVKDISLMGLARMGRTEKKWHSLFSSNLVNSIGKKMLIQSMTEKTSGPHAAVEQIDGVPQMLRVGLALTNLNGIDYMIPITGSSVGFNYTTSVDQKIFDISVDSRTNVGLWKEMCAASVGSGAFPAAFRPKAIRRSVEEYGPRAPTDRVPDPGTYVVWLGPSPTDFAYSDGGVLQNQPLGIAKNLVDATVADREQRLGPAANCDSKDRLYVFVTPHSVTSTAEALHAGNITIWDELKQLLRVYFRQAAFHDWITAEGVNQNVALLDLRAAELAGVMARRELNIDALARASHDLNALLMPNEEEARLTRLREQYSVEYKSVLDAAGRDAAEAFVGAIATLEAAAQLEHRDKMKIVAVTADPQKELAGSGFSSFVGFFKESYRQHDYWVGRVKTRTYLQRSDVKGILGVTQWPEEQSWQTALPNTSGVTLPLSKFQIAKAAFVPAVIMVVLRPALLLALLVALTLVMAVGAGIWHLLIR